MSIEWDSLILAGNELKTVGPATENARRANSVPTRGTNSRGAPVVWQYSVQGVQCTRAHCYWGPRRTLCGEGRDMGPSRNPCTRARSNLATPLV